MMNKKVISLIREMKDDYNYNESIKTLRTNIQFCGSNIHTIMFTSAMPDEGKSDVAFAAASSLAQIGKHVVFIDADIRKSVLVSRYQLTEEVSGLSQYLSGQKGMKEILYDTNLENLSVIFAGPYSPNPAELLGGKNFRSVLNALRKVYDYVIVDTPPVLIGVCSAIGVQICDGSIMVIESGVISYRFAQEVKSQLERSNCPLLGVVLNKVDMQKQAYGKYGKYGQYKYGEYGQEEDD